MSQGFTPGYPGNGAAAVSLTERNNWAATLSSHSGATLPGYAVEGMPFYDTVTKHLNVAKPYGSKAFSQYTMGPVNLAIALTSAGQNGSTYSALVRVRTNTIMSGVDHHWTLISSALTVDFNHDYTPAYFAAQSWDDLVLGEPALWTADGKLLGKNWETIPTLDTGIVYSGSPSPLSNVAPFVTTTLRAVDLEDRSVTIDASTVTTGIDHVMLALPFDWWQVQDGLLDVDLIEDGRHRQAVTFKVVPFRWGGNTYVVVYNRNALTQTLVAFDPALPRQLVITRKV